MQQQKIHVKVQHNNEYRRFIIEPGFKINDLKQNISDILHLTTPYAIRYLDEESEWINMDSDVELNTALDISPAILKLKIDASESIPEATNPLEEEEKQCRGKRSGEHWGRKAWKYGPHFEGRKRCGERKRRCGEDKTEGSDEEKKDCDKREWKARMKWRMGHCEGRKRCGEKNEEGSDEEKKDWKCAKKEWKRRGEHCGRKAWKHGPHHFGPFDHRGPYPFDQHGPHHFAPHHFGHFGQHSFGPYAPHEFGYGPHHFGRHGPHHFGRHGHGPHHFGPHGPYASHGFGHGPHHFGHFGQHPFGPHHGPRHFGKKFGKHHKFGKGCDSDSVEELNVEEMKKEVNSLKEEKAVLVNKKKAVHAEIFELKTQVRALRQNGDIEEIMKIREQLFQKKKQVHQYHAQVMYSKKRIWKLKRSMEKEEDY